MAIDLASSATVSTSTSVTIFDNPISNHPHHRHHHHHHHQQQHQTTALSDTGEDFKSTSTRTSTSTSILKRHHSAECSTTMKLDCSPAVQSSNGNGHINHPRHYHHHHNHHHQKGFIEHLRRSITLGGGVTTSLQPLTKLWLFRRQSSLTKKSSRQKERVQVDSKSTSTTTSKLDSNGNGASPTNGLAHTTSEQEVQNRLNGHANGHFHHHHHHQHQNLNITSNDIRYFGFFVLSIFNFFLFQHSPFILSNN